MGKQGGVEWYNFHFEIIFLATVLRIDSGVCEQKLRRSVRKLRQWSRLDMLVATMWGNDKGLSQLGLLWQNVIDQVVQKTEIHFLQFCRLEVWDQGTSMAGFWREASLWFSDGCSLVSSRGRGREKQAHIRTFILFGGLHTHELVSSQRTHLQIIFTLEIRASTAEFSGDANMRSITGEYFYTTSKKN